MSCGQFTSDILKWLAPRAEDMMIKAQDDYKWDVMDVSSPENGWLGKQNPIEICKYIAFRSMPDIIEPGRIRDTVCLRPISDDNEDMPLTEDLDLDKHPIAMRSFVTSLPVPCIRLAWVPDLDLIKNERGVVVGDMMNIIKRK